MLLLLLACSSPSTKDSAADPWTTVDSSADSADTGAPDSPPAAGDIEIGFQYLGGPYWQADVVLSEVAYAGLWVTMGAEAGLVADRAWTGECITAAWDYEGPADQLLLVVEVEWQSGAWSCAQLVGPDVTPISDCDVVQARDVRCGE